MRHPLHIQNKNDDSSIALAKLRIAVDDAMQAGTWIRGDTSVDDEFAVPMVEWSAVVEARKQAGRTLRDPDRELAVRIAESLDAIDLKQCYHMPTQQVRLSIQAYVDILEVRDALRGPRTASAYATEMFIRTGRQ